MSARSTLAVVMMTLNEEARISACLDAVAGWADEIVIIDDCSTDRTVEIARRYTDKIFKMLSEDDHCRQWNRGIERASSDWILHIDADERVTPKLKRAIDGVLEDDQGHVAFELMRLNFFMGHPMRYGGWYHRHPVLFRRQGSRCEGRGIHAGARLRFAGTKGNLDADLEHYPFSSVSQFLERQNRYTTAEVAAVYAQEPPVPEKKVRFQAGVRPLKLFSKYYFKQKARRDGWHGLVFSILYAFVHFMHWAKYWELQQSQDGPDGSDADGVTPAIEAVAEAVR